MEKPDNQTYPKKKIFMHFLNLIRQCENTETRDILNNHSELKFVKNNKHERNYSLKQCITSNIWLMHKKQCVPKILYALRLK